MEDKSTTLIAWDKVCRPKKMGGLGVLDLALHNKVLLMKQLHKFFNSQNLPRVKLVQDKYYLNRPIESCWIFLVEEFNQTYARSSTNK